MAFWIIPLRQTLCQQCDLNLSEKEGLPWKGRSTSVVFVTLRHVPQRFKSPIANKTIKHPSRGDIYLVKLLINCWSRASEVLVRLVQPISGRLIYRPHLHQSGSSELEHLQRVKTTEMRSKFIQRGRVAACVPRMWQPGGIRGDVSPSSYDFLPSLSLKWSCTASF